MTTLGAKADTCNDGNEGTCTAARGDQGLLGWRDAREAGQSPGAVGTDHVFGHRHETWDIHLDDRERWWVLTNPTNYYSQSDFNDGTWHTVHHEQVEYPAKRRPEIK
jgi:hypothetical protein